MLSAPAALGKASLSGKGILGFENEIFSYTHDSRRWIGVVSLGFFTGRIVLVSRTTRISPRNRL